MPEKKHHVFISYSSIDTEEAFSLLHVLEANGLNCWIAPRDIPQGAQWADEIDKAIQASRAFVVVISSNSVASKQVPKEVALAVSACEAIFPFRIDETELSGSFRYYLSDYQFVDAVQQKERRMQELAESIRYTLNLKPAEQAAAPKAPPADPGIPAPPPAAAPAQPAAEPAKPEKPAAKAPKKGRKRFPWAILIAGIVAAVILLLILGRGCGNSGGAVQSSSAAGEAADGNASNSQNSTAPEQFTEANASKWQMAETGQTISPLFGKWELVDTVHRGKKEAAWFCNRMYVCYNGRVYTNKNDFLTQEAENRSPVLEWTENGINFTELFAPSSNPDQYSLSAVCFLMDEYTGTVPSAEGDTTPPTVSPVDPKTIDPADATFETCYPERFLAIHVTGAFQESPVSVLDVDTWLFYRQQDPMLSMDMEPTLCGIWTDSLGNTWRFWPENDNIMFSLTAADGTKYPGNYILDHIADPKNDLPLETVTFSFDGFRMPDNTVLHYDGTLLYLLDENGTPFIMTRS